MSAVTDVLDEQASALDGETADAVRLISEETVRLTQLVGDLMEISRFDAGVARLNLDEIDLAESIRRTLSARGWLDQVRTLLPEPGALRARVDPRRLDVVLANLVGNALRHGARPVVVRLGVAGEGGGGGGGTDGQVGEDRIRGDRAREDHVGEDRVGEDMVHGNRPCDERPCDDGPHDDWPHGSWPEGGWPHDGWAREGYAVIDVLDSGPGIPPADLPHIFERFYKADTSRSRSENSGLGLAITAENVHLHGGRIRAANRPGSGAAFSVELPLRRPPEPERSASSPPEGKPSNG
jgi:two-component system sensor histidine kinase MtrB